MSKIPKPSQDQIEAAHVAELCHGHVDITKEVMPFLQEELSHREPLLARLRGFRLVATIAICIGAMACATGYFVRLDHSLVAKSKRSSFKHPPEVVVEATSLFVMNACDASISAAEVGRLNPFGKNPDWSAFVQPYTESPFVAVGIDFELTAAGSKDNYIGEFDCLNRMTSHGYTITGLPDSSSSLEKALKNDRWALNCAMYSNLACCYTADGLRQTNKAREFFESAVSKYRSTRSVLSTDSSLGVEPGRVSKTSISTPRPFFLTFNAPDQSVATVSFTVDLRDAATPEPGSLAFLGLGAIGLLRIRRRPPRPAPDDS